MEIISLNKILNKIYNNAIHDSEIILDTEAAKNIPGFNINWVLMPAVGWNRKELVEYLLTDNNININFRGLSNGCTALFWVRGNPILKLFFNHKDIDVNIQNMAGWTVLHYACNMKSKERVKELLLDARVDTLIRNNDNDTAKDIAIKWGNCHNIVNILKRIGHTFLLRIPNNVLYMDIVRMIIERYV